MLIRQATCPDQQEVDFHTPRCLYRRGKWDAGKNAEEKMTAPPGLDGDKCHEWPGSIKGWQASRVQNLRVRISESESQSQNFRVRIPELESQSQNLRVRISKLEPQSQNLRVRISESEYQSQHFTVRMSEPEFQS